MTTTPPHGDEAYGAQDEPHNPDATVSFPPIRDDDPDPARPAPIEQPDDVIFDGAPPKRGRGGKVVVALILGLLVLGAGLYVLGYNVAGDKVPPGTTVRGVDIGGLRPAAAEQRLRADLAPKSSTPIDVSVDDEDATIDPAAAGLSLDIPRTVVEAGGQRSWSPARMWAYFTGGGAVEPAVDVDEQKLTASLAEIGKTIDAQPVDGGIRFTFDKATKKVVAKVSKAEPGVGVDPAVAKQRLSKAFLTSGPVELATTELEPSVTDAEVEQAMADFVKPALSGPVTLVVGGEPIKATPRLFTKAIAMVPEDGELAAKLDDKRLIKVLAPAMRTIGKKPKDAGFTMRNGKVRIIPARVGVSFDKQQLSANFLDLLTKSGKDRKAVIKAKAAQPDFTTADARKLGIKRRVSTFTTNFPYAEYRNVNLSRAAQLINGTVLKPGETFSLNKTVGERTAENGFTRGYVISDGIFKEDFGGGVSQIATTTFNAMFFAGLQDVEHKPHSVYIDRYPVGREATVVWGALDLRFKNNTPYGIYIAANVVKSSPAAQGSATVSMYSTKYWDISARTGAHTDYRGPGTRRLTTPDCEAATGVSGFTINVWRDFKKPGSNSVVKSEKFHTVYNPSDYVVCGPPPKPKPEKKAGKKGN